MTRDSRLQDYLRSEFLDQPVYYLVNQGNAGDSLIAHATYRVFDRAGLDYRPVYYRQRRFDPTGKVILYGGGGNLIPHYKRARSLLTRFHRLAKRLVVLPHTIAGNEDLLAQLGPNVELICREEVSYEHVRRHAVNAKTMLMHDVAFGLDLDRARQESISHQGIIRRIGLDFKHDRKRFKRRLKRLLYGLAVLAPRLRQGGEELLIYRTDVERPTGEVPSGNIDLSAKFAFGTHDRNLALLATRQLIKIIDAHSTVTTNRLHIAILGALMGKPTRLSPNSYWKNRAVYEHSMRDRFPNVIFTETNAAA